MDWPGEQEHFHHHLRCYLVSSTEVWHYIISCITTDLGIVIMLQSRQSCGECYRLHLSISPKQNPYARQKTFSITLTMSCTFRRAHIEFTYEVLFHDICRCNLPFYLCHLANFFSKGHPTKKILDSCVDRLLWILVLHVFCISNRSKT